ncbi:L,D-transpeptidase family protein [Micromonospora auratinigra]|uniref:L,D-peptidoglycan transpeptidase YkuD, ErfK/YbiS/YcfS/YnhG family n=1 Tax=Micromonospora auratinigra TaxID=261654 RepID=A0A1A8ZJ35_9ACTN|nr:L,D-transpeptidase family protein [Micromonospora auratinigra]SBT43892.1 L,D-peptidoglycan transpeptidase YkuD, ErfK/YbiS/YcfS/YnhG family [Micromonospora auratinigra]
MKRRSLILGAAAGVAAPVLLASAEPASAAVRDATTRAGTWTGPTVKRHFPGRDNKAARLTTLPRGTLQVVVVTATSATTSYATLETFARIRGYWTPVSAALPARIGAKGFSDNHVEGVATTPTGVYAIGPTMYGIASDPGVRYPYHRLVSGDWWNENPNSSAYNSFQHTATDPGGYSEALWQETTAYTHFAVITYNMPPTVATPVPGAGSGIFLHQFSTSGGNPTAGCVSLSHDHLVGVLRWLRPEANPHIVLSPAANLSRY